MDNTENTDNKSFLKGLSDRKKAWLGYAIDKLESLDQQVTLHRSDKSITGRFLYLKPETQITLKKEMDEQVINDSDFSWVDAQDLHQTIWLIYLINSTKKLTPNPPFTPHNDLKKHFISIFDQYHSDNKQELIKNISSAWYAHKTRPIGGLKDSSYNLGAKKQTPFQWLNQNDEAQIQWAQRFLIRHGRFIQNIPTHNIREEYDLVCASISCLLLTPTLIEIFHPDSSAALKIKYPDTDQSAYAILFLNEMRQAWSKHKYRTSNKEYKNGHAPMTDKVRSKLKKIAKKKGVKVQDILENLIEEEYERTIKGKKIP